MSKYKPEKPTEIKYRFPDYSDSEMVLMDVDLEKYRQDLVYKGNPMRVLTREGINQWLSDNKAVKLNKNGYPSVLLKSIGVDPYGSNLYEYPSIYATLSDKLTKFFDWSSRRKSNEIKLQNEMRSFDHQLKQ